MRQLDKLQFLILFQQNIVLFFILYFFLFRIFMIHIIKIKLPLYIIKKNLIEILKIK